MNAPDFQTEAHNLELAQRDAQLQESQAELQALQRQVYIAARSAGVLPGITSLHLVDYLSLVERLKVLASRPAEPVAAPAPDKDLVSLSNREVEIACKGATIIDVISEIAAKGAFKRMDVMVAAELMGLASSAKALSKRMLALAKSRGIQPPADERDELAKQFAEASQASRK